MVAQNLPTHATPFLGRAEELSRIVTLLDDPTCRLLTLVGPGGIGKTRVAIEAARLTMANDDRGTHDRSPIRTASFSDGSCFVPLQPLTSPEFIISAIADALHFTFHGEQDLKQQLLGYLREKRLLLLLDNFEHLLDGADQLPEIMEDAPGVKLLVTSRERLRLREEWVLDVRGLPFPPKELSAESGDYTSVQLFLQNARRAGYSPATTDAASIARICQLTEGVPLAIELAAAWVRVMSCTSIASEIERSLDILTTTTRNVPEKHRSMRATFAHSWKLLSEDEQRIFRRLSVFRGGFTRDAAEHVAGASWSILASLADRSLLRVDTNGRYDLHELLRQYAFDQLTEADEWQAVLDRHQGYFLAFAESAESELIGANQIEWFERVEVELGNLRAAIGWSIERGDIAAGLCLTGSLYWFWCQRGHHHEGYEHSIAVLSLPAAKSRTIVRAKALNAAGCIQWFEGHYAEARVLLEEAVSIAREVGDLPQLARAVRFLGPVLFSLGESDAAGLLLEESLALARKLEDRFGIAWSLAYFGDVVLKRGNMEQAQRLYQEAIDLLRELQDKALLAYTLRRLGLVMRVDEAYERTKALCQESLELNVAIGDRRGVAAMFRWAGWSCRRAGSHDPRCATIRRC